MTRYENIEHDKVRAVAFSIARSEREKHPEVPVVISPTAWTGEGEVVRAVLFRVDRVIEGDEVPAEPTNKEENRV